MKIGVAEERFGYKYPSLHGNYIIINAEKIDIQFLHVKKI